MSTLVPSNFKEKENLKTLLLAHRILASFSFLKYFQVFTHPSPGLISKQGAATLCACLYAA